MLTVHCRKEYALKSRNGFRALLDQDAYDEGQQSLVLSRDDIAEPSQ